MQFHIPQFIDIEDKIFGPFTFKQFVYLLGGAGTLFITWTLFGQVLGIIIGGPIAGIALLLAFKSVNGRPFSVVLEAGAKYFMGNKLYLWKKEEELEGSMQETVFRSTEETEPGSALPRISGGKLSDISWNLDIRNKV
jgi:hypothetical protein